MTREELISKCVIELAQPVIDTVNIIELISKFQKIKSISDPTTILLLSCRIFDVDVSKVLSKDQTRLSVSARSFFAKHMYSLKLYTYDQIGQFLNGKDHATIINNIRTITDIIETDKEYKSKWEEFTTKIDQLCKS